jgi:hypothetical protein
MLKDTTEINGLKNITVVGRSGRDKRGSMKVNNYNKKDFAQKKIKGE